MTIGIMSAMPEENRLLVEAMDQSSPSVTIGKRVYHTGILFGTPAVVVFSRWGKVAASSTATTLINRFEIDQLLFTGVAGGISERTEIGDLVVADRLVQYDLDARPLFNKHEVPLLGITQFEADPTISKRLVTAVSDFVKHDLHAAFPHPLREEFSIHSPSIHQGLIASGDQFISSESQNSEITNDQPSTICVEMEGAAMAQVCYEHGIPFGVVRIISDSANHDAPIDFPKFVESIASHCTLGVIRRYLELLS